MSVAGFTIGGRMSIGCGGFSTGAHYNYTTRGHRLILSLAPPHQECVQAILQRNAVFGLVERKNVIVLLAGFGVGTWVAAHYNWWFNFPEMRPNPAAELAAGPSEISLEVILVDSSIGAIQTKTRFHFSPDFSRMLLEKVVAQICSEFDPWRHLQIAQEVIDLYPEPMFLMKHAVATSSCRMGPPVYADPKQPV